MVAVNSPGYSVTLDLDNKVRDFEVPPLLDSGHPQARAANPRFLVMQRALVSTSVDIGEASHYRPRKGIS